MKGLNQIFPQLSVATIPGPPAFVMIVTFLPCGIDWYAKALAVSNSSSISLTLITSASLNAVSYATALPAIEPVCEETALMPKFVMPALRVTMGLIFDVSWQP
jgi:hypothetical protein